MARATAKTKLPLDTWAKIMGVHPLHFNQVRLNLEDSNLCDSIILQHEWQNGDHVGREEIARAIADSESQIENYLHFRLAPTWEVDEWRETVRPFRRDLFNTNGNDIRGLRQTVKANWGYMISGGVQAKELIDADASIAYSDVDSDGYDETATVSVATIAVDKNEIAVFYPGESGSDEWEIRPTEVVISGGVATITFKRHQAVIPEKLGEVYNISGIEAIGENDSDFLTAVDVYRRYNDPQTQTSFLWEPGSRGSCSNCDGDGCSSCSYRTETGCLIIRGDPRQSIVGYHAAAWDGENFAYTSGCDLSSSQPDIVRLYYYAGWRNKVQKYVSRMDPEWERAVAYMAAARLDRPPCACESGNWDHWRQDLTLVQGDEDTARGFYRDPKGVLDNPFGSRRGEVYAWRKVRDLAILEGITV